MSHDHNHDESTYPIIWQVIDAETGDPLTTVVKHTELEALQLAATAFPHRIVRVVDTGKRKPPGKCCNKCGDKPCGS